MTRLIIARHGNTFDAGDIVRRVGGRTDLPLSSSGRAQAKKLGQWLLSNAIEPEAVYCSRLRRTQETAELAWLISGYPPKSPTILAQFDEIDYGPDENQPETAVMTRLGAAALRLWEEQAVPQDGWKVNPEQIRRNWQDFAEHCLRRHQGKTILVVTSNGIARFAPSLGDMQTFTKNFQLKLATGALGILSHTLNQGWQVDDWGVRPPVQS
jgi:2,3-bisphosphoglycerate-dependent phosphoglycerate mutase